MIRLSRIDRRPENQALAAMEPHALIVRDAHGIRAFATGTARVSLERLRQKIGNLDALPASIWGASGDR
jgi:hypothetical protein